MSDTRSVTPVAGDLAFTREDLKGTIPEAAFAGALSFMRRRFTRDLTALARQNQVKLYYSGTVAGGLPTVNLGVRDLAGCTIQSCNACRPASVIV